MTATPDGRHDFARHLFWTQHQRIVRAREQVRVDKPWPDVGNADGQVLAVGQLLQSLQISGLHGFRCRISRSRSQAFRARYRRDGSYVSAAVVGKIAISLAHHPCEAHDVGLHGAEFNVGQQLAVHLADARSIEEQLHTTHAAHQFAQLRGSIAAVHIDACNQNSGSFVRRRLLLSFCFQALQLVCPSCSQAYAPAIGYQQPCHFASDTRRGTNNNCSFHSFHPYSAPPTATSSTIISTNPMANPMVLRLLCSPSEASGMSSSMTT